MIEMFDQRTNNPASGQTAWDILHANAISRIGANFAEHHHFAEAGQLLVSFRGFDAIALVDPEAERVVWAARGFWWNQHDPDPLPNGNILVFDNHGHGGLGGGSRIVEFDPADNRIVWSYAGDADSHFWSRRRGTQQRLPNGNVLITSTEEGRLFEVTRDGEIVWNFYNPVRRRDQEGTEHVGIVNSGRRYSPEQLPFLSE
jgi:outer membrane protein assembly factor BamB